MRVWFISDLTLSFMYHRRVYPSTTYNVNGPDDEKTFFIYSFIWLVCQVLFVMILIIHPIETLQRTGKDRKKIGIQSLTPVHYFLIAFETKSFIVFDVGREKKYLPFDCTAFGNEKWPD